MPKASMYRVAWTVCVATAMTTLPRAWAEEEEKKPAQAGAEKNQFQIGATVDGHAAALLDESQTLLSALPFLSYERTKLSVGGAFRYSDVDLGGDDSFTDWRGELDASWRWKNDVGLKPVYRLIGYFARGKVDDEDGAGSSFDRSGMYTSYGARLRYYSHVMDDGTAPDGLFQDPKTVFGWSAGLGYRDADAAGAETEYRQTLVHADARWWLRTAHNVAGALDFTGNMIRVGAGYAEVRYPHRTLSTDDTDDLAFAQVLIMSA